VATSTTKPDRLIAGDDGYENYWTYRRHRIGASEAFSAAGGDGLMELYYRKLGKMEPEPISLAMRRGLALEPLLEELVHEHTGNRITDRQVVYFHDAYPELCARVDCEDENGTLVELKTVGRKQAYKLGLGDDCENIPERWFVQCQVQMLLAEQETMFLGVLISDPDEFRLIDVNASPTIQQGAYARCRVFADCVRREEPPFHLAMSPSEVARHYRPIEGETFEADTLLESLIVERQRLSASKAEVGKQLDEINNEIRAILKGRTALFGDGSTLSLVSRQRKGYTVEPSEYTQLVYTEASNGNGRD
jgi:hypothetical protein